MPRLVAFEERGIQSLFAQGSRAAEAAARGATDLVDMASEFDAAEQLGRGRGAWDALPVEARVALLGGTLLLLSASALLRAHGWALARRHARACKQD
jgi:hypothetical protein